MTAPLLELFSVVDDCFTEDDALSGEKRRMTLGRVYRAWKDCRAQLDPEFEDRKLSGVPIRRMGPRPRG